VSGSGVNVVKLGLVNGTELVIDTGVKLSVKQLSEVYESAIPKAMGQ
jgi:hypothetical protein